MALSCSLPNFGRLQSEVTYVYRGRGTRVVSTMCMIRRVKSGILDNESKKSECHSHANIGNYVSGSTINYATFMVLTSNILNLKIVRTRNTRQLAKGDETCMYVSVRVSVCRCVCVCAYLVFELYLVAGEDDGSFVVDNVRIFVEVFVAHLMGGKEGGLLTCFRCFTIQTRHWMQFLWWWQLHTRRLS